MSDSDRDEEEQYDFSGFGNLFDSLAQVHEENIRQAIRRFSILQSVGSEENQGAVASTPFVTPIGSSTNTPQITPIGSPRREFRPENAQLSQPSGSNSEPSLNQDISLTIQTLPLRSASSLQDIHLSYLSTTTSEIMATQAFDRALRTYTKVQKKVVKYTSDLKLALRNNEAAFHIEDLLATLEVEQEDMNTTGTEVNEFEGDQVNPSHKEEEWQDEWKTTHKKASAVIKLANAWKKNNANRAEPKGDVVEYEKLQVETFEGNPMIWPFWMETAQKIVAKMDIIDQRFWLKQKITGEAREFIGQYDLEKLPIDRIFIRLNSRYGQPHMKVKKVALETRDMVVLDESASISDIDKFWNKYMNIAGECKGMDLTAENLVIILSMLHLPPRFRERLETKMRETKEDYRFTRENTTDPYSLIKEEMLSIYPENKQKYCYSASPWPPTQNNHANYSPGNNAPYQPQSMENRGRSPRRNIDRTQYSDCTYCSGSHQSRFCQQYDTPLKRRDRLVALDRCRACMISLTQHQYECHHKARCSHHPGERHFWHLCDGPGVAHPGKQIMPNAQA